MAGLLRIFNTRWFNQPKPLNESFEGRNVIVTGATSGIGLEAVVKFAALGAHRVVIAARDAKKGATTKTAIENRLGKKGQLEVWELDMTSFESVVAFAKKAETLDHLDVAVLNAGVRKAKYGQSAHGWEEDLQVNTLSTTLLGILLLPKLKASKQVTGRPAVLEFVNSGLHQSAMLGPEAQKASNIIEFYNQPHNFSEASQYKFTKLFLMHTARILSEKVSPGDVTITSICPGLVRTGLARDHFFPGVQLLLFIAGLLLMLPPDVGANAILTGTAQGGKSHGRFWKSNAIQPIAPSLVGEENRELGDQIWQEQVEIVSKEVPSVTAVLKGL